MTKPDPELLPIQRPRCPQCTTRMIVADVSPGPYGFEHRKLECKRCGHIEVEVVACDPLRSDAIGWLSGELGRPNAVVHQVNKGSPDHKYPK
jgi:hypothetical protein